MNAETLLQTLQSGLPAGQQVQLREALISYINELIQKDFNALVLLLYRVDVSEQKLKQVLQQNQEKDAAPLIADLILQRQAEKQRYKQSCKPSSPPPADEERW